GRQVMLRAAVWNSGATHKVTSSDARSVSTRTLTAFQVRLPWVSKAPLARPVVPDVYMRTNGASSATGSSIGPPDPSSSESSRRSRSEEHTSELQSRENLVCRLLLEKKK